MEKDENFSEKNLNQEAEEATEESTEDTLDSTAEIERLKDQLLRTMAELENLRKRAEREKEEIKKYAISGFCKDLLVVSDTLDRAIESIPEEEKKNNGLLNNLSEGITLTRNEMWKTFVRHDVKKIHPTGEKFDHNFHQAVVEVESDTIPSGHVVDVLQSGYVIEDRLLRPAMVTVSKGTK